MRKTLAALLLLAPALLPAQPELLDPAATLYPGNGQLVVTGELIYQGRRGARDPMVVRVEVPRSAGVATLLASAPAEIGVFALAPSGEMRVEPGGLVTLKVIEDGRVAIAEHLRVERPTVAPQRRAAPAAQDRSDVAPEEERDRRAGGMYIGYRMQNRSPGPIAPGRGYAGGSVGVGVDATVGGGNFSVNVNLN